MNIIVASTPGEASEYVAKRILNIIDATPAPVLGLATGGTPKGVYQMLRDERAKEGRDFSHLTTFNLDEYVGLDPAHAQSYRYYMNTHLFDHINIPSPQIHFLDGRASDLARECLTYDKAIENAGGIDFQLLGIGHNGHIGFNEPSGTLQFKTHVTTLDEATIEANARFFDASSQVPSQAITMGVEPIMHAEEIVLMAFGEDKADIVDALLNTPTLDPQLPASILRLHRNVTIILDKAAANVYQNRQSEEGIQ